MRIWISLALTIILSGCTTYGDRQQAFRNQVSSDDLIAAQESLDQLISPQGSERILYWLELGQLQHRQQLYAESNRSLQRADSLTRAWLQLSAEQRLLQYFGSQDSAIYQPLKSDRWFLHYLQIKNFYMLAQQGGGVEALDGMRVEARRLSMLLDKQTPEELVNSNLSDLFSKAKSLSDDSITAYYWWWIGIAYERLAEWDNARIAYGRAASQEGSIGQQALADQLRMQKRLGDAWQEDLELLPQKLQQQVGLWTPSDWQTLSVQYAGIRPAVRELGFTFFRIGDELLLSARGQTGSVLLTSLYGSPSIRLPLVQDFDLQAINFSIPYVPPVALNNIDGMVNFSPAYAAHVDYQAQLPRYIANTLLRELSKAVAVGAMNQSLGSEADIISMLLSLYNAAVSGADTRYWMSMPEHITVARRMNDPTVQLKAGQVRLYLPQNEQDKE